MVIAQIIFKEITRLGINPVLQSIGLDIIFCDLQNRCDVEHGCFKVAVQFAPLQRIGSRSPANIQHSFCVPDRNFAGDQPSGFKCLVMHGISECPHFVWITAKHLHDTLDENAGFYKRGKLAPNRIEVGGELNPLLKRVAPA